MDYQHVLYRLKEILGQQLPKDQSPAQSLAKILNIKPHSAYRKLNGEIQFSVDDLVKISGSLSIPLGTLLDDYSCVFSHPMELILIENMSKEQGYKYAVETTHEIFVQAGKSSNSKFTAVCKNLPVISYYYHEWLMKFSHLKWLHFNNGFTHMAPLSELNSLDEYMQVKDVYLNAFHSIRRLVFILDGDIIRNFLLDLIFFRKVGILTIDEIGFLLDDLTHLLTEAEEICRKGSYAVSGQEVQVFYSDIALYNDMHLIESTNINLGIFYAQGFNPIIHREAQTFDVLRSWRDAWIRSSNPICGTGELEGRIFFKKQHQLVEEYRNNLT